MSGFVLSYDNLKHWCERQGFPIRENPQMRQLAVSYRILDRDCPLLLIPQDDVHLVTLAMLLPVRVPAERAAAVGEALNLLNHNAYMGAWVLDPERGEIYFRVTLPGLDNEYTDQGLHLAARLVVSTVEALAPRIDKLLSTDAAPRSVLPMPVAAPS